MKIWCFIIALSSLRNPSSRGQRGHGWQDLMWAESARARQPQQDGKGQVSTWTHMRQQVTSQRETGVFPSFPWRSPANGLQTALAGFWSCKCLERGNGLPETTQGPCLKKVLELQTTGGSENPQMAPSLPWGFQGVEGCACGPPVS